VIVLGLVVVSVPPPQVVDVAVATVSPAGSVSVNPIPVRSPPTNVFGLVIVKFRFTVPLSATVDDANDLAIVGGATTVRVAVLLATPVPPSVDCGALVALLIKPPVVAVTLTVRVQLVPGASVPPPKFKVVSPGVAFHVPVHVEVGVAGFATFSPAGKLSLKLTPVSVTPALGFVSVSVIVLTPFNGIVVGLNALDTVGGDTIVRVAL